MAHRIYMDTCGSADRLTVPIFTLVLRNTTVVYTRPVVREIARLCTDLDPENLQRGRQAAITLTTLQSLPHVRVVLDCDEPAASYADDDLLIRAGAAHAAIFTADVKLQQRAMAEGIIVLRLQDYYKKFRSLVPTIQELFPPVQELTIGDTVAVRVHKLGRYEGEGVGVLEDGRQVVIRDAADYLGAEVSATITRIKQVAIGEIIYASDPRPYPDDSHTQAT